MASLKTLDSGYGINNESDSQDEEEEEKDARLMIPNRKVGRTINLEIPAT